MSVGATVLKTVSGSIRIGWVFLLLVLSCGAKAGGVDYLKNIPKALKETNYQGVFVYARGDMMNAMQVYHRWQDGTFRERLVQLDGVMGEILRDDDGVVCILPGNVSVNLEYTAPGGHFSNVSARIDDIQASYQIELNAPADERVAGYHTLVLSVTPKDRYRYGYRLWIEPKSNLLLKSVVLGETGEILERFQFTQVEIGVSIDEQMLEPKVPGQILRHEYLKERPSDDEISWRMRWLPPGFRQAGVPQKVDLSSGVFMNSVAFSDGLASFTIFMETVTSDSLPQGGSRMGATTAYTRRVKNLAVTVVGEIPPAAAMKIADSIDVIDASLDKQ